MPDQNDEPIRAAAQRVLLSNGGDPRDDSLGCGSWIVNRAALAALFDLLQLPHRSELNREANES